MPRGFSGSGWTTGAWRDGGTRKVLATRAVRSGHTAITVIIVSSLRKSSSLRV